MIKIDKSSKLSSICKYVNFPTFCEKLACTASLIEFYIKLLNNSTIRLYSLCNISF